MADCDMCWYSLYLVFTVYLWKAPDVDKDKWQWRLSRRHVARKHLATSIMPLLMIYHFYKEIDSYKYTIMVHYSTNCINILNS